MNFRMSKEPLKSFINKMGTFRGKKASNRPSASDLKYGTGAGSGDGHHDESGMFKVPMSSSGADENMAPFGELDLDTTATGNRSMIGTGTIR